MMPVKRKRTPLTIEQKCEILQRLGRGEKVTKVAQDYNIGQSTVSDIKKARPEIEKFILQCDIYHALKRKSLKSAKDEQLDHAVFLWFSQQRDKGIPVSGPMLYEIAHSFYGRIHHAGEAQQRESDHHSITSAWLKRFKDRYGIRQVSAVGGDLKSVDDNVGIVERFSLKLKSITQEEENGQLEQLDNKADESGLFWRTLADKTPLASFTNEKRPQTLDVEESRNEKLLKHMLYQMTPQMQQPQQKLNISAALGKPANPERNRKSPLNIASTSHPTLAAKTIEVENTSPPAKKAREIHIDIDGEEPSVASKPLLHPAMKPPVQKSVTTTTTTLVKHKSVLDINVPQKQKRILVVPNHQQSVMSNLSSLWKAGRLCDAFIGNGTVNLKVHKMILGAVCPKVLDVFYNTPQHKSPKVTFPSSVSKEALLAFAEYMYNGVLDLDPDLLAQMKVIAQQMDMKDFEQLCNNQLKSSLVPNMLPTILEPMLSEPCSSSGLIQQTSHQVNQTSLTTISTATNNCSGTNSLSNLPLVEVRAETDDTLMDVVNNNLTLSAANDNICDINPSNRPRVKIENVDPEEDEQYGRETVSSGINYPTTDSIITRNFTHFSNTVLSHSPSSSSVTSTSQHTNRTLNKSLPVGHIWKQNHKDKGNIAEAVDPTDPYPIGLFTANWSNVPLLTQDIKKEYNVG